MRRIVMAAVLIFLSSTAYAGGNREIKKTSQLTWEKILSWAEGTKVLLYTGEQSLGVNNWLDTFAAESLKNQYKITLKRISLKEEQVVKKLLLAEMTSPKEGGDLLLMDRGTLKNAYESGLLWGPYTQLLPHFQELAFPLPESRLPETPGQDSRVPFGRTWFLFEYDAARIPQPPESFLEFGEWIKAHPGRFTYPQPPDPAGEAFLRMVLHKFSQDNNPDREVRDALDLADSVEELMSWLKEIEPYLWREGKEYPPDAQALEELFKKGEVDYAMSLSSSHADSRIEEKEYPPTVKTFVLKKLALSHTTFTAIPFNAPNKPGAMVVSNFFLSPQAQLSKSSPAQGGSQTVLNLNRLSPGQRESFITLDRGPAALPLEVLSAETLQENLEDYGNYLQWSWARSFSR